MNIKNLEISGCYLIEANILHDNRGSFVKTYHESTFLDAGLKIEIKEEYYSVSKKGVVRGMHFQNPPHDHIKMVYCTKGAVFDVFVDLRKKSKTYLKCGYAQLSKENGNILILAKGIAHGFCSLVDGTTLVYKTDSEYESNSESGFLWDSCGIDWPSVANPELLSERDKSFLKLEDFDSPFI